MELTIHHHPIYLRSIKSHSNDFRLKICKSSELVSTQYSFPSAPFFGYLW